MMTWRNGSPLLHVPSWTVSKYGKVEGCTGVICVGISRCGRRMSRGCSWMKVLPELINEVVTKIELVPTAREGPSRSARRT